MDNGNFDDVVHEIREMSEKTSKLITKTRKLIDTLDHETRIVVDHMGRIKKILGLEDSKKCPICMTEVPTYCVDPCHHLFCSTCSLRCIRPPSARCFSCRQPVTGRFKIYI